MESKNLETKLDPEAELECPPDWVAFEVEPAAVVVVDESGDEVAEVRVSGEVGGFAGEGAGLVDVAAAALGVAGREVEVEVEVTVEADGGVDVELEVDGEVGVGKASALVALTAKPARVSIVTIVTRPARRARARTVRSDRGGRFIVKASGVAAVTFRANPSLVRSARIGRRISRRVPAARPRRACAR